MAITLGAGPLLFPRLDVQIAGGTYNAFNPTGLNRTMVVVLSASDFAAIDINGIQNSANNGGPGRLLWIVCAGAVGGAGGTVVTLNHDSGLAAAGNRMLLLNGAAVVLSSGEAIGFAYDDDISRWVHVCSGGS